MDDASPARVRQHEQECSLESVFDNVHVIVQAGGRGERLRPITDSIPKPLVPVGGTPMIERTVRTLLSEGANDFTIITGCFAEQIEDAMTTLFQSFPSATYQFLRENSPRGNFGSVADVQSSRPTWLFTFADLVTDISFARALTFHKEHNASLTLLTHWETHQLQLGETIVEGDDVLAYHEKPMKNYLICSGICVFDRHIIDVIDRSTPFGISDFVNSTLETKRSVAHWTHGAYWTDVNSLELLEEAERYEASQANEKHQ